MKRIFRSLINISKNGHSTIPTKELSRNYKVFLSSHLKPEDEAYTKLFTWIEAHHRKYKELPSIELLYEKAREGGDEFVIDVLKEVAQQLQYTRTDFKAIVGEKFDEQNKETFQNILTQTWQACNSGLKIGPKKKNLIKGLGQAIEFFASETRKFRIYITGVKTDSQIRSKEDSKEVIDSYDLRKKDPFNNLGLFTQLEKMDEVFRGTKLGELMIIAAFVAQGKTTLAVNMAYNGIHQGLNGLFVSLEMKFDEIRDVMYTLHTSNADWAEHPKYKHLAGKISYEKVQYGELNDTEEDFFKAASEDFGNNPSYGKLFLHQPSKALTPSALEMEIYDRQAELVEEGKNLDFVVIDYVGLMVQDQSSRYGDFNTDLNSIIKNLKNLAIVFNQGKGLRIITPFQCNREGWKEAVKNDGVYKLTALSNANEAERSADQVIALFMSDEMKRANRLKICCLKHRRGAVFTPFEVDIDFNSKKIRDFISTDVVIGDGMDIKDIADMDDISDMVPTI